MEDLVDRQSLYISLFGNMSEEEEEEEEGLPIPPMEDEDFLSSMMMNNITTPDLETFFDEDFCVESTKDPVQRTKPRSYLKNTGRGKQLKVLKEALLPPTNHEEDEKKIVLHSSDEFSDARIEIAKRKLRDGYERVSNAKKQKRIHIIEVKDQKKERKNRGKTVKSRIEFTFRQLKKLHSSQRPKLTAAAY